jgi:hypothetical protein
MQTKVELDAKTLTEDYKLTELYNCLPVIIPHFLNCTLRDVANKTEQPMV